MLPKDILVDLEKGDRTKEFTSRDEFFVSGEMDLTLNFRPGGIISRTLVDDARDAQMESVMNQMLDGMRRSQMDALQYGRGMLVQRNDIIHDSIFGKGVL